MSEKLRHYEKRASIPAPAEEVFAYVDDHSNFSSHMSKSSWMMGGGKEEVFAYVDDHSNFSSHMSKSSWMMGGGKMETHIDAGHGQKVGSHIRMRGTVLGAEVSLDEVVTVHEPPWRKVWQTVGSPKLIVIGSYHMGVEIKVIE